MNNKPVDIVLVTWNRLQMSIMVIDTIIKNTREGNFRLIVVDNGSEPDLQQILKDYKDNGAIDELVLNDTNLGLEPARNQGLELVKSYPYFICADNDCLPERPKDGFDWIDRMVDLMDRHPTYGAITCRMQVMVGTGNIFDGKEDQEIVEFPHPGGAFRIMRTDLIKTIGGWRDEVPSRGQEERYIGGEINKRGYQTGYATNIHTYHMFGDETTDNWGYPKDWQPEESGHSEVWHPAFAGDDPEELAKWL